MQHFTFLYPTFKRIVVSNRKIITMRTFSLCIFLFFFILFTGCIEEENMCCAIRETDELSGSWLLYELGYSPGSEYITEDVPSVPSQIIKLNGRKVESTIEGFDDIKFYRVLTDTIHHIPYVAFYTEDPIQVDAQAPISTYLFNVNDSVLKLHFRWCIEGCHLAFKKIDQD
jgi:hypothetical protein